jgi:hypothetical protein
MKLKVYIAGPYSKGDVEANVRVAIDHANILLSFGYAPYVPHLNHFWNSVHKHSYEDWMALDLEFLRTCHALLRIPGKSPGADREVEEARKLGIQVYRGLEELLTETAWGAQCP